MTHTEPLYAVGDVLESKAPEIMNSCHGAKIVKVDTATQTYTTVDRNAFECWWGFHHLHRNYQKKEDPVQPTAPFKVGDKIRPKLSEIGFGNYFTTQTDQPTLIVTGIRESIYGHSPLIDFEPGLNRYSGGGQVFAAFATRFELVPEEATAETPAQEESEELRAFKAELWRKAQEAKDDLGWPEKVDEILAELGVTDPNDDDGYNVGDTFPVLNGDGEPDRKNFFLKTVSGWKIIWPHEHDESEQIGNIQYLETFLERSMKADREKRKTNV